MHGQQNIKILRENLDTKVRHTAGCVAIFYWLLPELKFKTY